MPIVPETQADKKSTLDDVARLTGVSRTTVSRVVNSQSASRETRERVLQAIAAVGYRPHQGTRHPRSRDAARLALLFLRDETPHIAQLLTGAAAQATDAGPQIAVVPCHTVREACEEARRLVHDGVDGFILPYPLCDRAELAAWIEHAGAAVVALSGAAAHSSRSAVCANEFGAAFAMTGHLIGLGHRRIGFIMGDGAHDGSLQLLAGYRCALEANRIAYDEALVADSVATYRCGLDAAQWLLERDARPTAIFASNDEAAAAAMAVAYRAGIEVPSDLTVAGFGDTALARAIWPALTSVRVPTELMVERAVQMLVRQIGQMRAGGQCTRERALLDGEVIRRQSDAAPRARPPAVLPARAGPDLADRGFKQVTRDHHKREGIASAIPGASTGDNA